MESQFRVSHNLFLAFCFQVSQLKSVSQLLEWLWASKPVKLDLRLVSEKIWLSAEVPKSFEQLLICVVDALLGIELWIDKASRNKRVAAKGGGLQHGNTISFMLRCTDNHIALGEGRIELHFVSFEAPRSDTSLKFLSSFGKYLGQLTVGLADNAHFEIQFLFQQLENHPEEGLGVFVMFPSVGPDYVHHHLVIDLFTIQSGVWKAEREIADPALLLHLLPDLQHIRPLVRLQLQVFGNVLEEGITQGGRVEQNQVSCQAGCDLVVPEKKKSLESIATTFCHLPVLEVPLLCFPDWVIKLALVKVDHLKPVH